MIDFHSHILPCIDDGSKSIEESLEMLRISSGAGVHAMVATPHFLRAEEDVESFIRRRGKAYDLLNEKREPGGMPALLLGAEVFYYQGIYNEPELESLCIAGTRYLLLEMPFSPWPKSCVKEVCNVAANRGIRPILAHYDRYTAYGNTRAAGELMQMGALIQINASAVRERGIRKLFKQGSAHLLSSDCHNIDDRKPDLAPAALRLKLGDGIFEEIERLGRRILGL